MDQSSNSDRENRPSLPELTELLIKSHDDSRECGETSMECESAPNADCSADAVKIALQTMVYTEASSETPKMHTSQNCEAKRPLSRHNLESSSVAQRTNSLPTSPVVPAKRSKTGAGRANYSEAHESSRSAGSKETRETARDALGGAPAAKSAARHIQPVSDDEGRQRSSADKMTFPRATKVRGLTRSVVELQDTGLDMANPWKSQESVRAARSGSYERLPTDGRTDGETDSSNLLGQFVQGGSMELNFEYERLRANRRGPRKRDESKNLGISGTSPMVSPNKNITKLSLTQTFSEPLSKPLINQSTNQSTQRSQIDQLIDELPETAIGREGLPSTDQMAAAQKRSSDRRQRRRTTEIDKATLANAQIENTQPKGKQRDLFSNTTDWATNDLQVDCHTKTQGSELSPAKVTGSTDGGGSNEFHTPEEGVHPGMVHSDQCSAYDKDDNDYRTDRQTDRHQSGRLPQASPIPIKAVPYPQSGSVNENNIRMRDRSAIPTHITQRNNDDEISDQLQQLEHHHQEHKQQQHQHRHSLPNVDTSRAVDRRVSFQEESKLVTSINISPVPDSDSSDDNVFSERQTSQDELLQQYMADDTNGRTTNSQHLERQCNKSVDATCQAASDEMSLGTVSTTANELNKSNHNSDSSSDEYDEVDVHVLRYAPNSLTPTCPLPKLPELPDIAEEVHTEETYRQNGARQLTLPIPSRRRSLDGNKESQDAYRESPPVSSQSYQSGRVQISDGALSGGEVPPPSRFEKYILHKANSDQPIDYCDEMTDGSVSKGGSACRTELNDSQGMKHYDTFEDLPAADPTSPTGTGPETNSGSGLGLEKSIIEAREVPIVLATASSILQESDESAPCGDSSSKHNTTRNSDTAYITANENETGTDKQTDIHTLTWEGGLPEVGNFNANKNNVDTSSGRPVETNVHITCSPLEESVEDPCPTVTTPGGGRVNQLVSMWENRTDIGSIIKPLPPGVPLVRTPSTASSINDDGPQFRAATTKTSMTMNACNINTNTTAGVDNNVNKENDKRDFDFEAVKSDIQRLADKLTDDNSTQRSPSPVLEESSGLVKSMVDRYATLPETTTDPVSKKPFTAKDMFMEYYEQNDQQPTHEQQQQQQQTQQKQEDKLKQYSKVEQQQPDVLMRRYFDQTLQHEDRHTHQEQGQTELHMDTLKATPLEVVNQNYIQTEVCEIATSSAPKKYLETDFSSNTDSQQPNSNDNHEVKFRTAQDKNIINNSSNINTNSYDINKNIKIDGENANNPYSDVVESLENLYTALDASLDRNRDQNQSVRSSYLENSRKRLSDLVSELDDGTDAEIKSVLAECVRKEEELATIRLPTTGTNVPSETFLEQDRAPGPRQVGTELDLGQQPVVHRHDVAGQGSYVVENRLQTDYLRQNDALLIKAAPEASRSIKLDHPFRNPDVDSPQHWLDSASMLIRSIEQDGKIDIDSRPESILTTTKAEGPARDGSGRFKLAGMGFYSSDEESCPGYPMAPRRAKSFFSSSQTGFAPNSGPTFVPPPTAFSKYTASPTVQSDNLRRDGLKMNTSSTTSSFRRGGSLPRDYGVGAGYRGAVRQQMSAANWYTPQRSRTAEITTLLRSPLSTRAPARVGSGEYRDRCIGRQDWSDRQTDKQIGRPSQHEYHRSSSYADRYSDKSTAGYRERSQSLSKYQDGLWRREGCPACSCMNDVDVPKQDLSRLPAGARLSIRDLLDLIRRPS